VYIGLYHGGQLYLCSNKMTKPNKNITVEPIPKSNIKIIEKGKIKTPNILIHDRSLSWLITVPNVQDYSVLCDSAVCLVIC
jgi:hypothetical protein